MIFNSNTKLVAGFAATLTALTLGSISLHATAEITQDCILEGTVDMHKAEALGQSVYVNFSNAERGSDAACSLSRRSKSRRVQYISTPDTRQVENVSHGSKVRYRYIEHNNQPGTWELMDVNEDSWSRSS